MEKGKTMNIIENIEKEQMEKLLEVTKKRYFS